MSRNQPKVDVLIENSKVGTAWLLADWNTLHERLSEHLACAFVFREVTAFYGKRSFPLEAVKLVKEVFPGAEVIGHRQLGRTRRSSYAGAVPPPHKETADE